MTRGFAQRVRDMEAWLSAPAQRQKMDRIAVAFPNQLGPNGGVDHLTSFTDFISQVNTACEVISERIEAGQEWFANYEFMCLSLSKVRSLLPKVQLCLADKSEIIEESKNLVKFREDFWNQFELWIKKRASDYVSEGQDGLVVVRRLMPDCHEHENQTFVQIRTTVRAKERKRLFAGLIKCK